MSKSQKNKNTILSQNNEAASSQFPVVTISSVSDFAKKFNSSQPAYEDSSEPSKPLNRNARRGQERKVLKEMKSQFKKLKGTVSKSDSQVKEIFIDVTKSGEPTVSSIVEQQSHKLSIPVIKSNEIEPKFFTGLQTALHYFNGSTEPSNQTTSEKDYEVCSESINIIHNENKDEPENQQSLSNVTTTSNKPTKIKFDPNKGFFENIESSGLIEKTKEITSLTSKLNIEKAQEIASLANKLNTDFNAAIKKYVGNENPSPINISDQELICIKYYCDPLIKVPYKLLNNTENELKVYPNIREILSNFIAKINYRLLNPQLFKGMEVIDECYDINTSANLEEKELLNNNKDHLIVTPYNIVTFNEDSEISNNSTLRENLINCFIKINFHLLTLRFNFKNKKKLEEENIELYKKIEQLEALLNSQEITEVKKKYEGEISDLKNKLEKVKTQQAYTTQTITTLQARNSELEENYNVNKQARLSKQYTELQSEYKKLEERVKELEQRNKVLEPLSKKYSHELDKIKALLKETEEKHNKNVDDNFKLQNEIEELRKQLKVSEKTAKNNNGTDKLNNQLKTLKENFSNLKTEFESLKNENEKLIKDKEAESNQVSIEKAKSEKLKKEAELEISKLRVQVQNFKNQTHNLGNSIQSLQDKSNLTTTKLSEKENKIQKLEASLKSSTQEEIKLKDQANSLRTHNASLKQRLAEAEGLAKAEAERFAKIHKETEEQNKNLNDQIQQLTTKLNEAEKQKFDYGHFNREIMELAGKTEAENQVLKIENEELRMRLIKNEEELHHHQSTLSDLKAHFEIVKTDPSFKGMSQILFQNKYTENLSYNSYNPSLRTSNPSHKRDNKQTTEVQKMKNDTYEEDFGYDEKGNFYKVIRQLGTKEFLGYKDQNDKVSFTEPKIMYSNKEEYAMTLLPNDFGKLNITENELYLPYGWDENGVFYYTISKQCDGKIMGYMDQDNKFYAQFPSPTYYPYIENPQASRQNHTNISSPNEPTNNYFYSSDYYKGENSSPSKKYQNGFRDTHNSYKKNGYTHRDQNESEYNNNLKREQTSYAPTFIKKEKKPFASHKFS
ncbi:MAG: hypothetical protein J0H68_04445 [Sphingobacteriia bacterium]|nr:hypothetical protein [Sphingobacteriia bacterium]